MTRMLLVASDRRLIQTCFLKCCVFGGVGCTRSQSITPQITYYLQMIEGAFTVGKSGRCQLT